MVRQLDFHTPNNSTKDALRRYMPPCIVLALLLLAWWFGWLDYISLSAITMHRQKLAGLVDSHLLLSLVIYFLVYAALVAISFPGASLMTLVAGLLFGGMLGGLVTVFAATSGAVLIFLVARSSFGDFLEQRASGYAGKLIAGFQKDSFNYLLSLRLTPVFPFWVINIVPAILNMRLRPYALATFLGIIPGTLAYAFIGAGLASVIEAQEKAHPGCGAAGNCTIDVGALVTPQLLIALVALGVIALIPVIVKRFGNPSRDISS